MSKSKSAKSAKQPADKPTLVAFLLDRSGSMSSHLEETISGFNAYIQMMKENDKKAGGKGRFTLTQFDSGSIDTPQDFVTVKDAVEINRETYKPGAYTPLYDAIGKTVRAMEGKAGDKFKVLFVTQTDGLENASKEFTLDSVRKLIGDKEKNDHWTFAYIGMGPEAWQQTSHMAQGTVSASNIMRSMGANSKRAFGAMAEADLKYRTSKGASGQSVNCSVSGLYEGAEDQTGENK